ncbi:IAA-alanine resistance protein 1 [Ancistrocladus abbreviatus]
MLLLSTRILFLLVLSSIWLNLLCFGQQSPATHHSCNHGHDHDHDHGHDHHRHYHHPGGHEKGISESKKLPEELAEEEDLKLYGFGSNDLHDHDHGPDCDHNHKQHHHSGNATVLSGLGLWVRAIGCSLLVSMASLVCLIIIPVIFVQGKPSQSVVDALAAFGAGAMLGDAFLHQLPHAFGGEHSHSHDHDLHTHHHVHSGQMQSHSHSLKDLSVGLSILSGIVLFLIVEKLVRYVEEVSGGFHSWGHPHHHHHHKSKKMKDEDDVHDKLQQQSSEGKTLAGEFDVNPNGKEHSQSTSVLRKRSTEVESRNDKSRIDAATGTLDNQTPAPQPSNLVFGYLNLFSDGVHNFTDGMALGSAFLLYGSVGGWSRTLFLLAHELPQEVGDFGILVRSGFSVSKALFFNFLSALVALAGTALALLLGHDPGYSSLIEGFTAGGFIYIAVAGVLGEMNNNGNCGLRGSVTQLTSLVMGMAVALCISLVE